MYSISIKFPVTIVFQLFCSYVLHILYQCIEGTSLFICLDHCGVNILLIMYNTNINTGCRSLLLTVKSREKSLFDLLFTIQALGKAKVGTQGLNLEGKI